MIDVASLMTPELMLTALVVEIMCLVIGRIVKARWQVRPDVANWRRPVLMSLPFLIATVVCLLGFVESILRWQDRIETGFLIGAFLTTGYEVSRAWKSQAS